jgi:hypothetical protein
MVQSRGDGDWISPNAFSFQGLVLSVWNPLHPYAWNSRSDTQGIVGIGRRTDVIPLMLGMYTSPVVFIGHSGPQTQGTYLAKPQNLAINSLLLQHILVPYRNFCSTSHHALTYIYYLPGRAARRAIRLMAASSRILEAEYNPPDALYLLYLYCVKRHYSFWQLIWDAIWQSICYRVPVCRIQYSTTMYRELEFIV